MSTNDLTIFLLIALLINAIAFISIRAEQQKEKKELWRTLTEFAKAQAKLDEAGWKSILDITKILEIAGTTLTSHTASIEQLNKRFDWHLGEEQ